MLAVCSGADVARGEIDVGQQAGQHIDAAHGLDGFLRLGIRIHQRRIDGSFCIFRRAADDVDDGAMGGAGGLELLVVLGGQIQPLLRSRAQAVDGVVEHFDVFFQRGHDARIGLESLDLLKLRQRRGLNLFQALGAGLQGAFIVRGQHRGTAGGEALAQPGQLETCAQAGNVLAAQFVHHAAELAKQQARSPR